MVSPSVGLAKKHFSKTAKAGRIQVNLRQFGICVNTDANGRFLDASTHLYKRVCLSVGPSVGPSVRNAFFLIGHKWVELNKNEISDDEAGRDYTSHDLFRVYELVKREKMDVLIEAE